MIKPKMSRTTLIITLLFSFNVSLFSQQTDNLKSTRDLDFLKGSWDVVRVYSPNTKNERILKGTLDCEESLDDQFIKCTYDMQRPGKIRGLDMVYFNYNSIYDLYESVWLSSTWPIKGILQGNLSLNEGQKILSTSTKFEIENKVMEYVRDELILEIADSAANNFIRKTHIRTSNYEEGVWHHHLTETVQRVER